jgi:hypothetical protein
LGVLALRAPQAVRIVGRCERWSKSKRRFGVLRWPPFEPAGLKPTLPASLWPMPIDWRTLAREP